VGTNGVAFDPFFPNPTVATIILPLEYYLDPSPCQETVDGGTSTITCTVHFSSAVLNAELALPKPSDFVFVDAAQKTYLPTSVDAQPEDDSPVPQGGPYFGALQADVILTCSTELCPPKPLFLDVVPNRLRSPSIYRFVLPRKVLALPDSAGPWLGPTSTPPARRRIKATPLLAPTPRPSRHYVGRKLWP
jgi:hypothetical protein